MSSHVHPRRRVRIAAAGLCVALGIGLLAFGGGSGNAGAASAQTVPSPYAGRVGLNTHEIWGAESGTYTEFNRMARIGVTRTREGFEWRVIEPQRGRFDWGRTDQLMAAAARTGIDVLPILGSPPAWASNYPDRSDRFPPANNADFANFAKAVVARYGTGGTFWTSVRPELSPMPVEAVQIWNEPWSDTYWGPLPDPAGYARLVRATGAAVHGIAPEIDVVISGDLLQTGGGGPIRYWVDEILRADPGLGAFFDAYSVHPYPAGSPMTDNADARWDFRRVELIRQATVARGVPKPIWITEIGWSTAPNAGGVSESTQASYTRQAITRAFEDWPYVKRLYLYSYDRDTGNTSDREGYFGVRHQDGSFKPVWTTLSNLLEDRTVTTSTTAPPTTTTAPPATTSTTTPPTANAPAVLGPARLAVRVLGRVFYYNPAPT
ncbi:MAG: beta-galactosidase [Acidimicrobiales bacterium]|nr:beta-galactosidase [Acidimicrobiales bacterium]